eukprot:7381117-Alexandrium_andersonii.AAC.1
MSASLVGSEMCIRDRLETGGAAGPPGRGVGAGGRCRGADAAGRGHAPRTVSYTHLTLPTICSV